MADGHWPLDYLTRRQRKIDHHGTSDKLLGELIIELERAATHVRRASRVSITSFQCIEHGLLKTGSLCRSQTGAGVRKVEYSVEDHARDVLRVQCRVALRI